MSSGDGGHLAARWPDLVRSLLALQRTPADAHDLALEAAVAPPEAGEDPDVALFGALVDADDARTRRTAGERMPTQAWREVLTRGARLDPFVVDQVLAGRAPARRGTDDREPADLGIVDGLDDTTAWADRYRGGLPRDELAALRVEGRRQRYRRAGAVVALLVVAAAAASVLTPRPVEKILREPPERDNAVARAWSTGDVLTLDHAVVFVDGVRSLAQSGTAPYYAAVWVDAAGVVRQVDADGTVNRVTLVPRGTRVVGSPDGLVAWIGITGEGRRQVTVWRTASRTVEANLGVEPGARLVSVDGPMVRIDGPAGPRVWDSSSGRVVAGGKAETSQSAWLLSWTRGRPGVSLIRSSGAPQPLFVGGHPVLDAQRADDGSVLVATASEFRRRTGAAVGDGSAAGQAYAELLVCDPERGSCVTASGRLPFSGSAAVAPPVVLAH